MESHEKAFTWDELSDFQKQGVVIAHKASSSDTAMLLRLFELGRPQVIIGYQGDRMKYCRIAQSSVKVMKVILREYL